MAWKIHHCHDIYQNNYSVIKTENSNNKSNQQSIYPQWVVMRDIDQKFILIDISFCPYCGSELL